MAISLGGAPEAWNRAGVVRARRFQLAALLAALAAGAGVSLAAAAPPSDGGTSSDAGTPRDRDGGGVAPIPPDPPPLVEREQWVFDLRWERGDVYLLDVEKVDQGAPRPTPRVMGRFALELYEGPTLIERVRFDFPMLGVPEPPDAGFHTPPRFEPGLRTRIGVLFPATKRGTRLELWDRARDQRWRLPWPPTEGPVTDGGVKDRAK